MDRDLLRMLDNLEMECKRAKDRVQLGEAVGTALTDAMSDLRDYLSIKLNNLTGS